MSSPPASRRAFFLRQNPADPGALPGSKNALFQTLAISLLLGFAMANGLVAQEQPKPNPPQETQPADAPKKASAAAPEKETPAPEQKPEGRNQTDSKPSPPPKAKPRPAVPKPPVLTVNEFLKLWDDAQLEEKLLRKQAPVEGVVQSASYRFEPTGSPNAPTGLTVQADLVLRGFQKGWSTVALSAAPLPLVKAETGKAFLTLGESGYLALLPDEGTYKIELTMAFPVELLEGIPTAAIQLPQSPLSSANGSLSGSGWTVTTLENRFPIQVTPYGKDTNFSFSPGAVTAFQLQWEQEGENKAKDAIVLADSEIVSQIRSDSVRSEVALSCRIPRAPINHLRVSIPRDQEVLGVNGELIKSWRLLPEEKGQLLEVWFSQPQSGQYQLQFTLEQSIPQLPFTTSLPTLRVAKAIRESGNFEIVEDQDVTTSLDSIQNLSRQASVFKPEPNQRHLGRYRFLRNDYGAELKIVETAPEISVQADTTYFIEENESRIETDLGLQIRGRAIMDATIVLPNGLVLDSVEGDFLRTHEAKDNRLSVSFAAPQFGPVQLRLLGTRLRSGASAEEQLPHFTVENGTDYRARIDVKSPPSMKVEIRDESSPLALRASPDSFTYETTPPSTSLIVSRQEPNVEVASNTEVHFKHHETKISTTLLYEISNRFPEQLLLRIPVTYEGKISLQSPTLRVIDRDAAPAAGTAAASEEDNEFIYWALYDQNKSLGSHQVEVTISDRLAELNYNQPLVSPSLLVMPLGTQKLDGSVTVIGEENVVLNPVTETALSQLLPEPGSTETSEKFEYFSEEAALAYTVTRLRYAELPTLAVDLANITHVVSGDGGITTEIAYRLIAEQASVLEIQLPEGAQLNSSVYCNDTPVTALETTEESLLSVKIQPQKSGNAEEETIVRFTYDLPSAQASKSLEDRGDLGIPVAELRETRIIDSRTALYLPPAYRYFGFETPMTLQSEMLGWHRAKAYLIRLLPALGAWTGSSEVESLADAAPVTEMPSFEYRIPLRKEGQKFQFDHSAAPAPIQISYLSQRYATLLEAGAFFLALLFGILISRQPLEAKLVFLAFGGLLALVAASFAAPHMVDIYHAVFLGAICSIAFWILAGIASLFRRGRYRRDLYPAPESGLYPPFSQVPEEEQDLDPPIGEEFSTESKEESDSSDDDSELKNEEEELPEEPSESEDKIEITVDSSENPKARRSRNSAHKRSSKPSSTAKS